MDENLKVDQSLKLTNRALDYNGQNIAALNHKTMLLFRKKDSKGLIQVADKLFEITNKPYYLSQKALYLELDNQNKKAQEYYSQAIESYKNILKNEAQNFDLLIEYIGILEVYGDTIKANKILNEMEDMGFEKYQLEMVDLYRKQNFSKEVIFKYWRGEIEYSQVRPN